MTSTIVSELIRRYREANGCSDPAPRVVHVPDTHQRGSYVLDDVHEDASVLLHQFRQRIKAEKPDQERIEVEAPQLVILARKVRTFLIYFCGFKRDKAIWAYEHTFAQQFNFAEVEKVSAVLGAEVFAMPAPERRRLQRSSL